jgi:hypothetical protein
MASLPPFHRLQQGDMASSQSQFGEMVVQTFDLRVDAGYHAIDLLRSDRKPPWLFVRYALTFLSVLCGTGCMGGLRLAPRLQVHHGCTTTI